MIWGGDGCCMRLLFLSFLRFQLLHTSCADWEKEIENDGSSSMTNFPFFYGSINLGGEGGGGVE